MEGMGCQEKRTTTSLVRTTCGQCEKKLHKGSLVREPDIHKIVCPENRVTPPKESVLVQRIFCRLCAVCSSFWAFLFWGVAGWR